MSEALKLFPLEYGPPSDALVELLKHADRQPVRDPEDHELWLRVTPRRVGAHIHTLPLGTLHFASSGSVEPEHIEPDLVVHTVREHLARLASFGVPNAIVRQYFVGRHSSNAKLYTVSRNIISMKGSQSRQQLGACLMKYVDWVEESKAELMLNDIDHYDQYKYGAFKGETTPRFYLIDTDPVLAPPAAALSMLRGFAEDFQ